MRTHVYSESGACWASFVQTNARALSTATWPCNLRSRFRIALIRFLLSLCQLGFSLLASTQSGVTCLLGFSLLAVARHGSFCLLGLSLTARKLLPRGLRPQAMIFA